MIISVSRRTDIPAFYAEWFINRINAGYCTVPNPFNTQQVMRISLAPQDVDVVVFWTRNPRPLFPRFRELDALGFRYYFQVTLMDNPRLIDPRSPAGEAAVATLRELARYIGSERVIWRYDPIVFSEITPPEFHRECYARLARALRGSAARSVVSFLDLYGKTHRRMQAMQAAGVRLLPFDVSDPWLGNLLSDMAEIAAQNGMEVVSCAEVRDLQPFGIRPGKCIDDEYIQKVFGLEVTHTKDPGQRKACGCVISKDIGMYDTCLFGCQYCYATSSFERAARNYACHNPASPSLLGWYEAQPLEGCC